MPDEEDSWSETGLSLQSVDDAKSTSDSHVDLDINLVTDVDESVIANADVPKANADEPELPRSNQLFAHQNDLMPQNYVLPSEVPPFGVPLRRNSKNINPLLLMKDFVTLLVYQDVPYTFSHYMTYETLAPSYQAYIATLFSIVEPSFDAKAIKNPR